MNNNKLKIKAIEKPLQADIGITIDDMFGWAIVADNGDVKTCTNPRIKLYEKKGLANTLRSVERELESMISMVKTIRTICLKMPIKQKTSNDGFRRMRAEIVMQMMQRFFDRHDVAFIVIGCSRIPDHISSRALDMAERLNVPDHIAFEHKDAQRNALETLLFLDYIIQQIKAPENDNQTKDPDEKMWFSFEGDAS